MPDGREPATRRASTGRDHEEVLLDPHNGLGGFMLVTGEGEKLARISADPEWIGLCLRGNVSMSGFGVVGGTTGEAARQLLGAFQAATAAAAGA